MAMSLQERANQTQNALLKKLFKIISEKQSNLCIAADGMSIEQTVKLVEKVGRHICILKIHSGQFGEGVADAIKLLYEYKKKLNFLLFEDRKFFDGEETVRLTYEASFVKYVDIVTVIPILGDQIFRAIQRGAANAKLDDDEPRGCLAVCELSFADKLMPDPYKLLEVAERNSSICIGIIAQKLQVSDKVNMIKATPGVNLQMSSDGFDQQWRSPEQVLKDEPDVVIVGRGITKAPEEEWESVAVKYKELCYKK